MKTLKLFLILAIVSCSSLLATLQAQNPCGVDARYRLEVLNPGSFPVSVHFFDSTVVTQGWQIAGWVWDFGNGLTSTLEDPTVTFTQPGNYTVCLKVYGVNNNSGGPLQCFDTICKPFVIPGCNTVAGYFTFTNSGLTANINSTFSSNHPPLRYDWNFGDGAHSDDADPSHTYTSPGVYNICVTVKDSTNCSTTVCKKDTIGSNSNPCGNVDAKFTITRPNSGAVVLQSTSTGVPQGAQYQWRMDGTILTNPNPNTSFTVTNVSPGNHYFCLYVYAGTISSLPCDSSCRSENIPAPGTCTAKYTSELQSTFGKVKFTNTSTATDSIYSYQWFFGDNTSSNDKNPFHTYTTAGKYYACLRIETVSHCVSYACDTIRIESPTPPLPCNGAKAVFTFNLTGTTLSLYAGSSNASGLSYQWSLDGVKTTSAPTHIQYQYGNLSVGTHQVCLYIRPTGTGPGDVCDSLCKTITVTTTNPCARVTAAFTHTATSSGATKFLPSDTSGGATHHIWSFGDNTSSYDVSPTHSYTNAGTYRVCHYVYIVGTNCVDSLCKNIQVGATSPCANIRADYTYTFNGQTLNLRASGTYPTGTLFQWSLDGGTRTAAATTHKEYQYPSLTFGAHRVCLYVYATNTSVPCDSVCKYITLSNPCNNLGAGWTKTVLQNGSVKFTPLSTTAQGVIHGWSFGDGTTSGDATPIHAYAASGQYRVCHYVYIPGTACVDSSCDNIQVTVTNNCAGFTAFIEDKADTGSNFRHKLFAHATTVNTALTYKWSNNQTTSYIIVENPGVYCVTVTSANCTAQACDSVGGPVGTCNANYKYEAMNTLNGVHFVDLSTGSDPIIGWKWSFGDGTNSVDKSPAHTYPNGGAYKVCLTITTASGCSSTKCDSVRLNRCYGLNAAWTQTYLNTGGVQFKGVSTPNSNVTHKWTFGDGTSSTNADPVHYYANSGLYTVCHIVTIPGTGCADTVCKSIQAGASASCHAGYTFISPISGNNIYFTSTSTSNDSIVSYTWNFGDGGTGTGKNTVHQFPTQGAKYKVCLTITTAHGCTNTFCDSIRVGNNTSPCKASFRWRAVNCLTVDFENTSPAGYTGQKWIYGDGTMDTTANPKHTYLHSGVYRVILENYYTNNCIGRDTMEVVLPNCTVNDTVCGVVFGDSNNNGIMDNGESGIDGVQVFVGGIATTTDNDGRYKVVLPKGPHYVYISNPAGCIPTLPLANSTGTGRSYYINGKGATYCGYNFGVNCNVVHVCGTVFFDANNNGVKDSAEAGLPSVHVVIIDSSGKARNVYTNQHGEYCETMPAGMYTITVDLKRPGNVTPDFIPVDASAGGQTYGGNNFAVYAQPGACDLKAELTARTCVSPGFPAWYSIQVCNVGTNPTSGTVNMFYDPALTFAYAAPAQASHNQSTNSLSWPVNNLMPGQCAYYWVTFKTRTPLTIGAPVLNVASVTAASGCNDVQLANNVDSLAQVVKGSWDPNNKLVDPIGEGEQGFIRGTEVLTYTINFQNTGTAPAVNVILKDVLPANLDLQTFQMVSSNPPYTSMQMEGNEITWKFSEIMLPDSGTDEPGSHGYVSFSILPVPGLPELETINNSGDIYFDYNEGIVTEQTVNTIDYVLAVNDIPQDNITITLQPNPFKDYTIIKIQGSDAPYELRVYDMLGHLVNRQIAESNMFRVEKGNLSAGVYLYEVLQQNKTIGKGKMIAE